MAEYMLIRLTMAGSVIGLFLLLCGAKKLIHVTIVHMHQARNVALSGKERSRKI